MKNIQEIKIVVVAEYRITLWQAIKLRIAGTAYKKVAEEIMKTLKGEQNGVDIV